MFFVMVEISNYRQLSRLRPEGTADLKGLLEHFGLNRGGRLLREQNGFFLFSFHPQREKVLDQIADFLVLTSEGLQKRQGELFGYSVLLEQDETTDEALVFSRLKTLIFVAPLENRVWLGPNVRPLWQTQFPVGGGEPLSEFLGPRPQAALPPLTVDVLVEMTGWIEALKVPLSRQLEVTPGAPGKILRLKGTHLTEKLFVLRTVLHQLFGVHDNFPVLFPLEDSQDSLSQLLARVDLDRLRASPQTEEPAWAALLASRGGGDFPGDSGAQDVVGALSHYFRMLIDQMRDQGLPPVFVFLVPHRYQHDAQAVLDTILVNLVEAEGLRLLLLEPTEPGAEFLGHRTSLSWTFPALTYERVVRERDHRGWQARFPQLSRRVLEACQGRGLSWVHHLMMIQEGESPETSTDDPSWVLFRNLDATYHKVYFLLDAAQGLLEVDQLAAFLGQWGEDRTVVEDRVRSLGALGFFPGGVPFPLRRDFRPWLEQKLGSEGQELLRALGRFLFLHWKGHHSLSEVLFPRLQAWGLGVEAETVLRHYLTNKINQGSDDFLALLRPTLWAGSPTEDAADRLRLLAASAKLRFALNRRPEGDYSPQLDRFRKAFGPKTETVVHGEWHLQHGRLLLRQGDLAGGFALLKKALQEAQSRDDRSLEIRAEAEIGLALLRKGRTEEAREYFDIATRLAERSGSAYLVALVASLHGVALFLLGNLSAARDDLARGVVACDLGGVRKMRVFLAFLRGRIDFDVGDYSRASQAFDEALDVARRFHHTESLAVVSAWKGRALAYAGNLRLARQELEALAPSAERHYFLAETWYFDRDWARARTLVREALPLVPPTQPFGWGEHPSWATGFAAIEDRALTHPGDLGVLANQLEGLDLLLTGWLEPTSDAARGFQALLARKTLLDLDPASAQLYFWYYQLISKTDPNQEAQRLTLLGRSLKDVQVRSSRIEDTALRQEFLLKPYWNTLFTSEARKLKLL